MDQNLDFWSKALDGSRETDGFQPEYKRTALADAGRASETYRLSEHSSEAFWSISRDKVQNLFLLLSAGASAILSKYCFSPKIIYATPVLLSQRKNGLKNRFVLCVNEIDPQAQFTELVKQCGTFYQQALRHQNVAEEVLAGTLELGSSAEKPLVKTLMLMKDMHDAQCVEQLQPDTALLFDATDRQVSLTINYNATLYSKAFIDQLGAHLLHFYDLAAAQPNRLLSETDVLSEEEHQALAQFQGKTVPLADGESILTAFRASVEKFGARTALVENGERMTYAELDAESDRIAGFIRRYGNNPRYVGIYMRNGIQHITAIIGALKAGAAYVPIDYDLPYDRIKSITEDISLSLILSQKVHIPFLNKLQNECGCMKQYLCLDTEDVYALEEQGDNDLSDRELWEFVGRRSTDSIEGGGWQSSYTGENLSAEEMDEYGENVRTKLLPYLSREKKALEVGCASGITMFRIAPNVKSYYGTDLAQAILDKDMEIIRERQITNITLSQLPALEIDTIPEQDFDIIIVNSVIQCFNGYNYFRKVLEKLLRLSAKRALIFIGDVMDAEKKDDLIESLRAFAARSSGKGYTTKIDWSQELFFSKAYFSDLKADYPEISDIVFSDKIGTIQNELTEFRYDVMLFVDKESPAATSGKTLGQFGCGILHGCERYAQEAVLKEEDPAYVIYTSGTTGRPKGIEIKCGALMRYCKWSARYYELDEHSVVTRYARVGFDAAVWELFPSLCAGSAVHIIPEEMRLDLIALNDYFNRNGVTFSFLPTQMFEQFMDLDNHSLRMVATGGDKLSTVRSKPYRIINNYGPTETTIVVTAMEVTEDMTTLPIGRPIDNVRIHILDRCGLPQPIGTVGEICIAGPNLAKGYVNLPELTREKFCPGRGCGEDRIYHSGDLGRWLPDGTIEFFGRMDGQIKISAFRIEMEEISSALCEMNCITQAVVRAIEDEGNSRFLCAYAVTDSDSITVDEIRRYLHSKLPDYMVPPYIFLMPQFPVTPNGKTDYAKLPDPRDSRAARDLVLPENEVETTLLTSFRKALGTDRIGVTDSFFEVGGNSIKAIKLVAELTQNFEVTINDVFTYQTVRTLADHITAKEKNLDSKFVLVKEALDTISGADPIACNQEKYDRYLHSIAQIKADLRVNPAKYTSIFFTGVTGFLGINLLRQVLDQTDAQIYSIIRGDNRGDPLGRLLHKWEHQFGGAMPDAYRGRMHIMAGDLTKDQFGLSDVAYQELADRTDCIINTAANVRHYGHHEEFSGINAELIRRLGAFAQYGNRKDLHHVSTIGVAEGVVSQTPFFLFTEDDSDVGQIVTNYYTETKLQAERYAQEARSQGVHVNLYRVGNLCADSETGIFQENIDTNGFYKTLRAMLLMQKVPDTSVRMLDFSFIDQIADSMVRLVFSNDGENQNYHLFNPNQISMTALSELLDENSMAMQILSADAFLDYLHDQYDSAELGDYIKEFILHTRLFSIPDETHFTLVCNRTCEILSRLGFTWKKMDGEIIRKMLAYCVQTGFLPTGQEV